MTSAPVPESPAAGVTRRRRSRRRSRSSALTVPSAASEALRFQPPTAEEVGRAAALCFRDTESDEQIAQQLGIVRRTLARWKRRPDFAAAMAALQAWQEIAGAGAVAAGAAQSASAAERFPP